VLLNEYPESSNHKEYVYSDKDKKGNRTILPPSSRPTFATRNSSMQLPRGLKGEDQYYQDQKQIRQLQRTHSNDSFGGMEGRIGHRNKL
jgi:hypothetical protein